MIMPFKVNYVFLRLSTIFPKRSEVIFVHHSSLLIVHALFLKKKNCFENVLLRNKNDVWSIWVKHYK